MTKIQRERETHKERERARRKDHYASRKERRCSFRLVFLTLRAAVLKARWRAASESGPVPRACPARRSTAAMSRCTPPLAIIFHCVLNARKNRKAQKRTRKSTRSERHQLHARKHRRSRETTAIKIEKQSASGSRRRSANENGRQRKRQ